MNCWRCAHCWTRSRNQSFVNSDNLPKLTPPPDTETWILAGQSNMVGMGALEDALPPAGGVWNFSSGGRWEPAREPLHDLARSYTPVHNEIQRARLAPELRHLTDEQMWERVGREAGGAGLGLAFGQAMHASTGRPIGLLPCAHGGVRLKQWGSVLKGEGVHSLYGAMLDRLARAGGNIGGVLWYQGEGGSGTGVEGSADYAELLDAWIADVRTDLGQPDLPVIVVQLGGVIGDEWPPSVEGWSNVRTALAELPLRVPRTAATSAIDLGLCDPGHIDTPGLIRLGRRMAGLALALLRGETAPGPRVGSMRVVDGQFGFDAVRVECPGVRGGWLPRNHASGFALHELNGTPHETLRIINVSAAADDASALRILLNGRVQKQFLVSYGYALKPYCNLVDEADNPLPAFEPRLVQPAQTIV